MKIKVTVPSVCFTVISFFYINYKYEQWSSGILVCQARSLLLHIYLTNFTTPGSLWPASIILFRKQIASTKYTRDKVFKFTMLVTKIQSGLRTGSCHLLRKNQKKNFNMKYPKAAPTIALSRFAWTSCCLSRCVNRRLSLDSCEHRNIDFIYNKTFFFLDYESIPFVFCYWIKYDSKTGPVVNTPATHHEALVWSLMLACEMVCGHQFRQAGFFRVWSQKWLILGQ